ncbi:PITH domain-containing protein P35G2.02 like [Verticillium longisporum]|uniref:PITH domain-containing protein P35G2.02 like n=1 Tax=Verticillium longisporum TaxID=100787 RepID=A0A8I2ZA70_VERLO|nr:PITH domain-containing protein P35G2.02 like [Verticillium longisporum]
MSDLLSDLMCESNDATRSANHPLLAIGQMANLTDPRRPRVRPVIAMAAGESGQLLRLCALRDSTWRWGTHQSPALHRLHLDADDADEVAHWAHDDSPILQVKAAMSLVGNEPSRYIIVQKKLATTVLKPQYRTIPVAREHSGVGEDRERPSRIDPKPVMVVSSHDTGGRPHADVSYCPGSEGKPELLAVVDDFGYWYVWEMQGRFKVTRPGLEPDLRFHGHIEQGIFDVTPTQTETTMLAATHGILWIGTSGSDWNHWDAALVAAVDSGGIPPSASSRATAFIVWSQKQLALVDLRTVTSTILDCPVRTTPKDLILDVKQNPANQRQIFVLTTTSLFWIEISPPVAAGQTASGPRILLSCAHLRSANNRFLKLKVHHGWSSLGDDASLVCLHSSRNPDIDIYAFSTHETTSLPQFQHHMVRVPGIGQGEDENGLEMQTFCLAPAILTASTPSTGPGAAHMDRDDHFWQLFVLNQDLGLKCSLVVATSSSHDDVRVPNTLKVTGKKRKIVNQRRTAFIQQLAEVFAVPDAFGEMDELFRLRQGAGGDLALIQDGPGSARRWPRSKVEGIDLLFFRVGVSMETVAMESRRVEAKGPFQGFDLIHRAVAQCLSMEDQQLPLSTLRDYQPAMEAPPIDEADEQVWDAQLHEFYSLNDQRIVIQSTAARFFGLPVDANLSFSALRRHCEELWPATDASPEAQISRRLALAETAEASIRSLVGVMAFDFTSSETYDGLTSWVPEPKGPKQQTQAGSSQRTVYPTPRATASVSPDPSSQFEGSQSGSSQSQTSQQASQEKTVPGALQRLSMLARHVNKEAKIAGSCNVVSDAPATFLAVHAGSLAGLAAGHFTAAADRVPATVAVIAAAGLIAAGAGYDHVADSARNTWAAAAGKEEGEAEGHSLYQQINFDEITTLNEAVPDSGRAIVKKTWADRLSVDVELESDADEQLLMNVPFTAQVKLHALLLRTSPAPSAPRTLHVFLNRDDLDFASAEDSPPTQTFELAQTSDVQEIPVRRALFGKVRRLTLFFPDNFSAGDDDVTRLSYVGFRGEWTALGRAPTNIVYESAARPSDHTVKGTGINQVGGGIGGRGNGM